MARQEVVDIAIRADIEQLKAQLKSIPGMSDDAAKKMAGNISKQLNKAAAASEKAAAKSQKAWKKSATSLDATERASAKAASTMGKFASALSTVSPEAATAAQVIQKAADGVEALAGSGTKLTASLGVIGVALAAAGAAYLHFRNEIAKTDEAIRVNRERLSSMVEVHRQVKEAAILSAVAQGQMSQEAADGYMIAQRAGDIFADRIEEQRKRVSELKNSLHEAKQAHEEHGDASHAATGLVVLDMFMATQGATDNADAVQGLTQQLEREETALTRLNQIKDRYVKVTTAGAEATLAQREAVALEKVEAKEAAAAQRQWNAAMSETTREAQRAAAAVGTDLVAAAAAIDRAWDDLVAEMQRKEQEALEGFQSAVGDIAGSASDAWALAADARASQAARLNQQLIDGEETLSESQKKALEARVEAARSQAMKAHQASQVAALASIAIDTAAATVKAYAMFGPPPSPAGMAAAAAAVAAGAVSAATVMSEPAPEFHAGGVMVPQGRPDERGATLLTGEGVLSRQGVAAVGGEQGVAAINRGQGGQSPVIVVKYKHREFNAMVADNVRQPGSPLRAAIKGSTRVGRRKR